MPPLASHSRHVRPPSGLPTRWMPCAEVFTLHKLNHTRQDNLWLPLSNENSNAFLHRARLGFRPQTRDPLLTPGCLWITASVGGGEGAPPPNSSLPALLDFPEVAGPAEDAGPLLRADPSGAWEWHAQPQESCTPTRGWLPLHFMIVPSPRDLQSYHPKANSPKPQLPFLIHHVLDITATTSIEF